MATDLYDTSLGDDVSLDVGPLGWLTIRETGHEPMDEGGLAPGGLQFEVDATPFTHQL